MEFNINKWGYFYLKSHSLSKELNYITKTKDKYYDSQEYKIVSEKLKQVHSNISDYLNKCGIRLPKPLWHYEASNERTHYSSPKFAYKHLVKPEFQKYYE